MSEIANPNPTDYALRKRVTDLIREAKAKGQDAITSVSVYEGLISNVQFFRMLEQPHKIAWMIRPVVPHTVYYDAIHKSALKKIWQILEKHDVDPKYLPQIVKLAETAGNRMHGPVVQKIQMAQKQEITHISGQDPSKDVTPDDPALLEAKIREMQAKLNKAKPLEIEAKVIDDED